MDLGPQKLKGTSPASRRSACGGPASPAAPRGSLCASFHSPAPMAISWVFAIGPSQDAVKRSFLIGRKTSHASTAATTTAMCSTVGLPHWPAASLHLAFPLPLPIGCPGRGSALPTSIGQRGARRGLGRVKSAALRGRARLGFSMAGQGLAAGFLQVPTVTRAYTTACVLTTAAVVSGPAGRAWRRHGYSPWLARGG